MAALGLGARPQHGRRRPSSRRRRAAARDVSTGVTEILLSVRADGAFWLVECPDGLEPLQFGSAAEAREKAQLLASCLTQAGIEVRILLHDKAAAVGNSRPSHEAV